MCFADGDFLIGDSDVLLGELDAGTPEPVKVYMSVEQFAYWENAPHLTIDIVPGRGAGFSLEAPTGNRFLIRSRLFHRRRVRRPRPGVARRTGRRLGGPFQPGRLRRVRPPPAAQLADPPGSAGSGPELLQHRVVQSTVASRTPRCRADPVGRPRR